jgi:hypothetical protein
MDDEQKLVKIIGRYFPPGIILKYKRSDDLTENKVIDLLNLSENSDLLDLVKTINEKEPLTIKYKSKVQIILESN